MKKEPQEQNKLCKKCLYNCRQSKDITLINCPKFKPKPQQLVFKFKLRKLNESRD